MNPYLFSKNIIMSEQSVAIHWTNRANKQITKRSSTIIAEMQLYFSCVVKKRVIFTQDISHANTISVSKYFHIAFNAVEAAACSPVEFAANFPAKRILDSSAALKMRPKELKVDFKQGQWVGEFTI